MPGSLRIARVFGIEVRIHLSWLSIFGLLLFQLSDPNNVAGIPVLRRGEAYLVATITALLFFASVVTHELAHSLGSPSRLVPE